MSSQMQEIQRYLKVRVDQMQDLTYNNLKKLAEERLKIEVSEALTERVWR